MNDYKQRKVAVKYVELCGLKDGQRKVGKNCLAKTQSEIAKDLGISNRNYRRCKNELASRSN